MTQPGDVVLVTIENNPAFFARVESITPDVKPGWYQMKMLVLQIPLLVITWILRDVYINGEEFTMGGRPVRVSKVVTPEEAVPVEDSEGHEGRPVEAVQDQSPPERGDAPEKRKVVSLMDRKKKERPS
jgi:hypothetical protein